MASEKGVKYFKKAIRSIYEMGGGDGEKVALYFEGFKSHLKGNHNIIYFVKRNLQ